MRCHNCGTETKRKAANQKYCAACRAGKIAENNRAARKKDWAAGKSWKQERQSANALPRQSISECWKNLMRDILRVAIEEDDGRWLEEQGPTYLEAVDLPANLIEIGAIHGKETQDQQARPHYKTFRPRVDEARGSHSDIPRAGEVDA